MSNLANALGLYDGQVKVLSYGTAGFRENVGLPLTSVFVKMGVLAALRSQTVGSKCIGLMVTASHNPECDNGVKIVDSDGGMMTQSWEPYAEEIVNTKDPSDIITILKRIADSEGVVDGVPSVVVVGRDTRPHSEELAKCIITGAEASGATVFDMGLVTTPQLHFIVQKANENASSFPVLSMNRDTAIANYHDTLGSGYLSLLESIQSPSEQCAATESIVVDGSYGIGAISVVNQTISLNKMKSHSLQVDLRNGAFEGPVNDGCGAEYVQKLQLPPRGIDSGNDLGKTICSYDGDADRIVFHSYLAEDKKWILLDGDKIAAIFALFISQEFKEANLHNDFKLGIVQTAYANGASTIFLKRHEIDVIMAKTGVKFLHHKAHEFDVGIYFEANGHGTVLFSERFLTRIQSWTDLESSAGCDSVKNGRINLAMRRLNACAVVINQAVGDAVSDMLMTLATLKILNMDIPAWNKLYTDLPSKQLKVKSLNKSIVKCSDDETYVFEPVELQVELNRLMNGIPLGRCFVRPSGTEDVMRVYAEGKTQDDADQLANDCVTAINKYVG